MEKQDIQTDLVDASSDFSALDEDFIRVLEDVIDALLNAGVLRLTDLPPRAIDKLNRRKKQRNRLLNSLDLLPDDDAFIGLGDKFDGY